MEKKELFKYLIKEFHETKLPNLIERDLKIPHTKKITTLVGSRRTGKTFYFYQFIKAIKDIERNRILYINFEDDRIWPLSIEDLKYIIEAYYEMYPDNKNELIYMFFDEIQKIKGWEIYVRRIYDKENVQIFVTGSSASLLSREIATSLRGRTVLFDLYPLSFKEFLKFNGILINQNIYYSKERYQIKKLFEKYLIFGGFPEVVLEKNNLEHNILTRYFETVLYKDIMERFSVRNAVLLKTLSKFLLTNISAPFSINAYYNSLKEITSVSKETIFEYVSYLEEAGMVFLVPLFSYSLKKQQTNPKKAYCIDNGLRNAVSFNFSKDEGRLAENLAFIELMRREKEIYYWKGQGEVDFVIKEKDNSLIAINVCYNDDINKREIGSLIEFNKNFKKTKEMIVLTRDLEKEKDGIKFIPLWKWLTKAN